MEDKVVVVLAMHGSPPRDFPKEEMQEYFQLHSQVEGGTADPEAVERFHSLERKMRRWPRNAQNDPFWAGSQALAQALAQILQMPVLVGFNEFCAPSVEEALQEAIRSGAQQILVVTPMMTRGGVHAEKDIPRIVEQMRARYPDVELIYAWPFDTQSVAAFLASHLHRFLGL